MTIFFILAVVDLKRHGRAARRWREYAFLIACVVVALIYGAVNDQVSSAMSWEYFYYGKQLDEALGTDLPPDRAAMRWEAAKIGMGATWSVGLLLGAALLIANNPRKNARPPLALPRLFALVPLVITIAILFSALGCAAGWVGLLDWAQPAVYRMEYFRPRHFSATWGEHLGGYAGGAVGGVVVVMRVLRVRRNRETIAT